MPVSIVSNLSSQYAQSAIRLRNEAVSDSTQRLSSGSRVFSASEDAAALAVGTGLKIENAALNKARLNATGGVAMLQVADGALGSVQDILVRLKTLATQASSGNVSDSERALVNQEFSALKLELDRIAGDTEFNGVSLLAGSAQFSYDEGHALSSDGISLTVKSDSLVADGVFRISYDSATEALTATRVDGGVTTSQTIDMTALLDSVAGVGQNLSGAETAKAHFGTLGVEITLDNAFDRSSDLLNTVTDNTGANITFDTPVFTPAGTSLGINAVEGLALVGPALSAVSGDLTLAVTSVGGAITLGGVAGLSFGINGGGAGTSGAASGDIAGAATVEIYVDNSDTGKTLVGTLSATSFSTGGDDTGTVILPLSQGLIGADFIDLNGSRTLTYMVGTGVIEGQDLINVTVPTVSSDALNLATQSITTQSGADVAITAIGVALDTIAQARAEVGAQQVRLEQVAATIAIRVENNELAKSALLDVDVAEEITNLSNNNAMLEVGVSMLTQSNRLPQILMQMLRNA
ncbi:MAG: hypothetical protein COY40_06420 [Alphaproteobacteria bacterium CG_4_10_14_0_8_um_filter_53_9]|nr:MAG: hypothetical protein COY40_06420 [Alphaproteobacteria bacterium CG_4_10_14_0_8_um_filter_53_9]